MIAIVIEIARKVDWSRARDKADLFGFCEDTAYFCASNFWWRSFVGHSWSRHRCWTQHSPWFAVADGSALLLASIPGSMCWRKESALDWERSMAAMRPSWKMWLTALPPLERSCQYRISKFQSSPDSKQLPTGVCHHPRNCFIILRCCDEGRWFNCLSFDGCANISKTKIDRIAFTRCQCNAMPMKCTRRKIRSTISIQYHFYSSSFAVQVLQAASSFNICQSLWMERFLLFCWKCRKSSPRTPPFTLHL